MNTETTASSRTTLIAKHLSNYYESNQLHLKWSFWASIAALSIGLIAILAGVALILSGNSELTSSIATIGGVLTQFIGAGFFFLYTKNLKQLNIFYEKLIKLQDTEYAIELIDHLPDDIKGKRLDSLINMLIVRNEPQMDMNPDVIKAITSYAASQNA